MRFQRASGVLLHISSLPGPHGCGDLGANAYRFVDWLHTTGQSLWQILPLGGLGLGHSPYMSTSAFAGNVLFIDLEDLQQRGWLTREEMAAPSGFDERHVQFDATIAFRMTCLSRAATRFEAQANGADRRELEAFCGLQADWLEDYALFMALGETHPGRAWTDWERALAQRQDDAMAMAAAEHAPRVQFWKFCQWTFFRQWQRLRSYANQRGVKIVGDVPIFISHDSAEVWSRPDLFELDERGLPTVVAGVPPDAFSATGQRWGNPQYRWARHETEGFQWWTERIRKTFELVDMVRIDHFRGFESYWEIPAEEPTAMNGRWVRAPGDALFKAVQSALGELPIIAEDLGVITPEVDALRRAHGFPGMRILQFAFNDAQSHDSHYLPHRYEPDTVVYPGTHDNDTALGWWSSISQRTRDHVCDYLACDGADAGWSLIRAASASVADLAIHPLQDVLRLGGEHRMNLPGTAHGNWGWRFLWTDLQPEHTHLLRHMTELYGRLP